MAAIQRTRNTSSVGGMLVAAIAAALLLGAAGGYAVRSLNMPVSAPAAGSAVQHPATNTTYELPAYVEKYVAPQEPRQFRVDEYLESLSYANAGYELPAWIEKYVAPQEPRRFRVDEYLEGLSYAKSAPIVDNATVGFTQQ